MSLLSLTRVLIFSVLAISEGHGEAALVLLREGAESDKKDRDGYLAIDMAPDKSVGSSLCTTGTAKLTVMDLGTTICAPRS